MSYIIGRIGEAGNIINTSYAQLDKLEVQYEGTDTWLDCSVADNISNKSNTSFTIRVKDGQIVTNTQNIFLNCNKLTSLDLSSFNTSNVTNMYAMFRDCRSLTSLDLSNFNTSNVTSMANMFRECRSLTSLDLSNFNNGNVDNMYAMFNNCSSLISLDLSNFNTSKVTKINDMFYDCSSLISLDLSNFDTSKVTDMSNMFINCSKLTSLDLSSFNTSNVTSMYGMFRNCSSLTSLDLSNFNTSNVTSMANMFRECRSLTSLDLSNFNNGNVDNMYFMFSDCSKLTSLDLSNWNINLSKLSNYQNMLSSNSALEVINLSYANQDTISVIYNSVPSQAITVKTTPENMAYATDTAPSNVTVIDVISTIRISTTKQQLLYNILYGIQNANIIPQTKEELILYGIMMGQDVDVRLDTIVQILYYTLLKKGV